MTTRDDDDFRPKVRAPKWDRGSGGHRFVSRVLANVPYARPTARRQIRHGYDDARIRAIVQEALRAREEFLVEQGLGQRARSGVVLRRDLLAIRRTRELESASQSIATETGLIARTASDGTPVSGVYRRSIMLASGRFAMLDDGLGFSLVPWRPVLEKRLGQSISAVVRGDSGSWELGRSRGLGIG